MGSNPITPTKDIKIGNKPCKTNFKRISYKKIIYSGMLLEEILAGRVLCEIMYHDYLNINPSVKLNHILTSDYKGLDIFLYMVL